MDYKYWLCRRGSLTKKRDQKEMERLFKDFSKILEECLKIPIINDLFK